MLDRLFGRQVSLEAALAALARYPFPPDTISRLQTYLTSANPADLTLIRAEDLMARLGLDEQTTLELLATAVHEGLLDLHWDVYCPACKGNGATWDSLQQAVQAAACPHCQTSFDVHADDEIAVRFSLNPRYGRAHPPPAAAPPSRRRQPDQRPGPAQRAGLPRPADPASLALARELARQPGRHPVHRPARLHRPLCPKGRPPRLPPGPRAL